MTTDEAIAITRNIVERRPEKPRVVISCITYNHEPFIRDALEGFVNQKTDFRYVAVVHDDCSTDGTAGIIREYAERYPDLIIPLLDKENLYSRKDGSLNRVMMAAIEATDAEYVAACEGDDYWTDPTKLQCQYTFLSTHPDYTMCFHNVNLDNKGKIQKRSNKLLRTKRATTSQIIIRGGDFVPTLSIMARMSVYSRMPERLTKFHVGDYPLQMYMAMCGKIWYINRVLGNYRISETSWTHTAAKSNIELRIRQEIEMLDVFDEYSGYKYQKSFDKRKNLFLSWEYFKQGEYAKARKLWLKSRSIPNNHIRYMVFYLFGGQKLFNLNRLIKKTLHL